MQVEALGDVVMELLDAVREANAFQVLTAEGVEFFAAFVGVDLARVAHQPGQGRGQAAGAAAGFDDAATGPMPSFMTIYPISLG